MKTTHTMIGTLVTLMLAAACTAPAPAEYDGRGGSSGGSSSGSSGSAKKDSGGEEEDDTDPPGPAPKKDSGTTDDKEDEGTAEVEGSINGKPVTAVATVAYTEPSELTIKVTDYAGACAIEKQDGHKKNGTYLKLNVTGEAAGVATIKAGTYQVAAPSATAPVAKISAKSFDDACTETAVTATAGEIKLESVTDGMVKGSFKATIGGKDVSGTFESPSCSVPDGVPAGPCVD